MDKLDEMEGDSTKCNTFCDIIVMIIQRKRITFEWDEEKNKRNMEKHGIDFETAARVFTDPDRIERYDASHSVEEDRFITIGMIDRDAYVVVVVYTERHEAIRMISARLASQREREAYYDCKEKDRP